MSVKLGGNAPHNGGHCQFALSYNGGKDWIVFYTIVRNCMPSKTGPIEFEYNIPIPADTLPGDKIVFSWNWINASGEREFYMNCIDIKIENPSNPPFMAGLALLVVNLDGYAIIDEFARPGSDDGHALLDARKKVKALPNGSITPLKASDGDFTFHNTSNPIAYNVRRPPEYYETSELPYSSGDQFESINQQHKFRSHSHNKNRATHI
jgi:predicted carbohydrate-binding protein with CBM5 and CBM33 domain